MKGLLMHFEFIKTFVRLFVLPQHQCSLLKSNYACFNEQYVSGFISCITALCAVFWCKLDNNE